MNETSSSQISGTPSTQEQRRFLQLLLLALIFSIIVGIVSLATDVISFKSEFGKNAKTIIAHHIVASRVALSAVTIFHVALVAGLLRRAHLAWRAALALPILWALLICTVHSALNPKPVWPNFVPLPIIIGIGIWQTIVWRKQWAACESLFQRP